MAAQRAASSVTSRSDVFGRVARTIVDLAEQEGVSTDEDRFRQASNTTRAGLNGWDDA